MTAHSHSSKQEVNPSNQTQNTSAGPDEKDAEQAIRTLLQWIGENPDREELRKTPARVLKAYKEHFAGYHTNPEAVFGQDLEDAGEYRDFVALTNIRLNSHCEHHMHPIIGKVHIAYWPGEKLAGLSKLARAAEILSKRLVSQERLTIEIRDCVDRALSTKGSAVVITARHLCMSTRGISDPDVMTTTSSFSGVFEKEDETRKRFLALIRPQSQKPQTT